MVTGKAREALDFWSEAEEAGNSEFMLKKCSMFLFFLIFFLNTAGAVERPFVISGFDDVLRQAENTGLLKSAIKIFEKDKEFLGMPELYTTISRQENDPRFILVSAISTWFDGRIDRFLTASKFPSNERFLRNWLTQWSIEKFKIATITEILKNRPGRKFIVIFDNSDASIVLAEKLHELFPDRIQAVYLRYVIEKQVPLSAVLFFTAFDIAMAEYRVGRMTSAEVIDIGNVMLKATSSELLFPSYAICPSNYDPCKPNLKDVDETCMKVRAHVRYLCRKSEQ